MINDSQIFNIRCSVLTRLVIFTFVKRASPEKWDQRTLILLVLLVLILLINLIRWKKKCRKIFSNINREEGERAPLKHPKQSN